MLLNEIGCWRLDWEAIGAIATAAAVVVAMTLPILEKLRRRQFSKFLFHRDVLRLQEIEVLLRQSANSMHELCIHRGEHPDEDGERNIEKIGFIALSRLQTQLEYFGRSEKLYEYNLATEEFANLEAALNGILAIPSLVDLYMDRFDGVHASDAMLEEVDKLNAALRPFSNPLRSPT